MNLEFVDPGSGGHTTAPVERVRTCASCGAELDRVRGTIAVEVRCPDCRSGGEFHLSPSGQPTHAIGPAVSDPVATDGAVEMADAETIERRINFDVEEFGLDRDEAVKKRLGDADVDRETLVRCLDDSRVQDELSGPSLIERLRELGLEAVEVYWYLDEEPAVHAVFETIEEHPGLQAREVAELTGYHDRTVYNAVGRLRREYGVVRAWKGLGDSRRHFYTPADAESLDRTPLEEINNEK